MHVIRQTMEQKLTQVQAGTVLGLTTRHIRRLIERVEQAGDQVINWLWKPNSTPNFIQAALRGSSATKADVFAHMEWNAPALMMLRTGLQDVGQPEGSDLQLPSAHLLTPETETSTHYFWTVGRDRKKDDTSIDELFLSALTHIFSTQDGPMIEQQQQAMGEETDLFAHHPVVLSSDAAAVRARRILQKLIREEANQRSSPPRRAVGLA